jgi:glycosyltransferase involved in cell wall biosynthesis
MPIPQISVCICTFKREDLLRKLLDKLETQQTEDLFSYSVVIADNDAAQSAKGVLDAFRKSSKLNIRYCVEPQKNIAMVRNAAIASAEGDLIAFIDDDEVPEERWLLNLYRTLERLDCAGVLGPVKPYFEGEAPSWITTGGFFDRLNHPTGYVLDWPEARTGNVLFRKSIIADDEAPFAAEFDTAGEDVDFFRRMMGKGFKFVWCAEASAFELVPKSRCTGRYLLRRALLRGSNFHKHKAHRIRNVFKSLLALPLYAAVLPLLALLGKRFFMKYLIKICDHGARLLAHCGFHLVTQREL